MTIAFNSLFFTFQVSPFLEIGLCFLHFMNTMFLFLRLQVEADGVRDSVSMTLLYEASMTAIPFVKTFVCFYVLNNRAQL